MPKRPNATDAEIRRALLITPGRADEEIARALRCKAQRVRAQRAEMIAAGLIPDRRTRGRWLPPAVVALAILLALAAPAAANDVRPGPEASWWLVSNPPPAVRIIGGEGGLDCQPEATVCTVWAQGAWDAVVIGDAASARRLWLPGVMR